MSGTSPGACGSARYSTPWIVSLVVMCAYGASGTRASAISAADGVRMNPSLSPLHAARAGPSLVASCRALALHEPVTTTSAGSVPWRKFIGTIENCCVAPPWQNTMWWVSGTSSSERRLASTSLITPSNQGLRWDTSSADAPTPGNETRSRCASSRTGSGRIPGPGAKFRIRPVITPPA